MALGLTRCFLGPSSRRWRALYLLAQPLDLARLLLEGGDREAGVPVEIDDAVGRIHAGAGFTSSMMNPRRRRSFGASHL